MASLLVLKGANQGMRIPLEDERVVLGRNPDCHVVISGTAVSREHAHILRLQGKYYIEDQGSRNKTFVNNQEIPSKVNVPLKDNDRIKICDFLCTFHDTPARKPLPPELRREEPEPPEEGKGSTTVEAALSGMGNNALLEAQPAEKLKALLDIFSNLSNTLALDSLWPKVGDSLFQLFRQADRCFLILREEGSAKLIPRAVKTRRQHDETSARFSRHIVNRCLESNQALLSDDATSDQRFATSQSIADFRIRSVMCVPLWHQDGSSFGVIQLDTQDRMKKFTQDDLKLLMAVAGQAAVALENARMHEELIERERYRRDLDLAAQVQRGFLPTRLPAVAGYEFFAHYKAAQEVGGDYYDFIPLAGGRWATMLGDVAGKGVPAALLMAKISSDARTCMLTEPGPAEAVTRLNLLLGESAHTDRFVTLVAALLDPRDHTATLVNAGHPSPLVYRRASARCEPAVPTDRAGLPIGVLEGERYTAFPVRLDPGDCLLVFSDGVTDAMDARSRQFQVEGVCAAVDGQVLAPRALGERLVQTVEQYAAGRDQFDDMTLVCFGRVG